MFLGFPCGSAGKESAYHAGDLGWEDPLEKGKATHSSILAWRIPWTALVVAKSRTRLSDFNFHLGHKTYISKNGRPFQVVKKIQGIV